MTQRINATAFSTEQQREFERLLREEGIDISVAQRIPRRPGDDHLPLSFAQQRLWFLDQLETGTSVYNMTKAFRLIGDLKQAALESALTELVGRHESLRTTFAASGGEPRQIIAPTVRFPLAVTDLSEHGVEEREQRLRQLLKEEEERPFDLSRGPLFRASLWRLGASEHVFYVNLHHIVCDGWSMMLLFRELGALYRAGLRQQAAGLAELPIQYADYALWQREWLQGERLEEQLEYWRRQLAQVPAVLELPTDYARPTQQSYHGRTYKLKLNAELVRRVKQFSQATGCTAFMTLLTVFKVLLQRYTGQGDIVVGTPVAGRNRGELEGLIGVFINTLVLRTDLSDNPRFKELLQRVREVCLGAYGHQDLPFEKLVEELQPERSLSHTPLCQIAMNLQNSLVPELGFEGLQESPMELVRETSKFDLTFSLSEDSEELLSTLQYNTDLFEPATIESMADHYCRLLESAISQPDQRISDLKMLTQADERQLLIEWNATQLERSPTDCIHELFEKQVAKTPEAIAVISETGSLTYLEVNKRANQLAHYLRSLGVGPEELVGVCLERSMDLIIALLGIMKAGGAYVPIDPAYPRARLAFMLEDAQIKVLITEETLLQFSQDLPVSRVSVDGDRTKIAEMSDQDPANLTLPDNRAYIIFTSGSTGKPKGIEITHRSVATLFVWVREFYTPQEMEGVLASASICFDISVFEIFAPLTQGTKCILAKNALVLPGLRAANQVTLLDAVPSTVGELVRMQGIPSSVRMVNLPGEPLSATLVQQLFEQDSVERAVNLYGPSEDTTFSTYALLTRDDKLPPPIGRPVANTQIYILDKHFQLLPARVPGELYIGGDGVSRGYLNHPAQTAERYLPNPYGPPGSRMYKTGDLARYRLDGNLEYLGRIDHQVKIRGFRIEPGEIEAVLDGHDEISKSIVTARENANGAKQLVAYVVMSRETFSLRELRNYIKERLPEYMIPSIFVRLDSLPYLPNSKVDRLSLPDPEGGSGISEHTYQAPQTPVAQVLASFWAGLLGVKRVGVSDNFFELGGHSLLAVQLISRIRELFLVELPLLTIFEAPTINLLSAVLTEHESQSGRTEKIAKILLGVQQKQVEETGISELFEAPTIADLTRLIEQSQPGIHQPAQLPPIPTVPRNGNLPVSIAQEAGLLREQWNSFLVLSAALSERSRLFHWTMSQVLRGLAAFGKAKRAGNDPTNRRMLIARVARSRRKIEAVIGWIANALIPNAKNLVGDKLFQIYFVQRWSGPLKIPALNAALNEIIRRHEILRTNFSLQSGAPVQTIKPTMTVEIPVIELRSTELKVDVQAKLLEEVERPFDLESGPLLRLSLFKLTDDEHIVTVVVHHFVCDGFSLDILKQEIATLYHSFANNSESSLPELPIQYADFAVWERKRLRGEVLETLVSFWKNHLTGAGIIPEMELPFARSRPLVTSYRGQTERLALKPAVCACLNRFARELGVTTFMFTLAVLKILLHRYTGKEYIAVRVPFANRLKSETEKMIGWFAHTLFINTRISGNPPFSELLNQVRDECLGAYEHQEISFTSLFASLMPYYKSYKLLTKLPRIPFVSFSLRIETDGPQIPDIKIRSLGVTNRMAKPGISFALIEKDAAFQLIVLYEADVYDAGSMKRMLIHFQEILEAAMNDPDTNIMNLPISDLGDHHLT